MARTRIMLVEDEAIAALCIRTSLEKLGYDVPAVVARGAEAIRLAAEIRPDLILMDITLADDVTGIEAAEAIREAQQIPIIFMTAHVDAETVARAKRAEPFGYLTKPFNPESLKYTIEVALYKSAADARVRESERSYRLLAENATDMISRHAPDGTFLFASPSFFDGIGHAPQELVGRQVYDYIHPADIPVIRKALASVPERSSIATVSYRFRHKDDGYRWMEAKAKTLRDPLSREIQEFIVSTRDISERKAAEAILLARLRLSDYALSHSLSELLTKTLDEAEALTDSTIGFFHFLDADQETLSLQAWSSNTLATMCSTEGLEEHYPLARAGVWADGIRTRAPVIHNHYERLTERKGLPSGHVPIERELVVPIFRNSLIVALLGLGNKPTDYTLRDVEAVTQLANLTWDIVERKRAELERRRTEEILRESEARYKKLFHEFETIFNAIPDSLTLWLPDMRLLWANLGTRDHYLRDLPELLGKPCVKVCTVCHDEECEVKRCFRSQGMEHGLKKTRDGRIWGIKTFPLKDDSGAVVQVIRLASDLTERMHLREETARAAHLAALGELAAGVAHEINNPAGLILLEMPILRDAFRDAEPILEEHFRSRGDFRFAGLNYSEVRGQLAPMIEEITDGAQRIKQIVQELKDFSRPAEGNPFAVVDLNEVVRKANSLVSGKIRNLTDACSIVLCEEPVTVMGNFQKLEQVVINLLVNAAQALTERTGLVEVRVCAASQRGWGVVTVRDEGVGIRPEHLPVITDPFFTTRREVGGTGLGLSVSMRIVQDHGGSLFFDSEPGRGTLVTLELPLHKEVPA